jgi:hypothetical protein
MLGQSLLADRVEEQRCATRIPLVVDARAEILRIQYSSYRR